LPAANNEQVPPPARRALPEPEPEPQPTARITRKLAAPADEPSGGCVLEGTLVATPLGPRPIETIRAGDLVIAALAARGERHPKRVARVFHNATDEVVRVTFGPRGGLGVETVECTPGHRWFVEGLGWTEACALAAGEPLVGALGEALEVRAVAIRAESTGTYNFEVEEDHTYFVAATPLLPAAWVHNQNCSRAV